MELDHNPIGASVLDIIQCASLNESGSIKSLSFRFCSLQDTPKLLPDVFSSMKNITSLNLNGNHLGDSGLIAICRSLAGNQSLEQLYLQANKIQNSIISGVYPMEIVRSVFSTINTTLKELDLALNFIDEIGSIAILDTIKDRNITSKNNLKISISERVSNEVFSKVWTLTGGSAKKRGKGKTSKKK